MKTLKSISSLFLLVICLVLAISCDEEDVPNPTDPCSGADGFCMMYGSVQKSGDAELKVLNSGSRMRVYWENGSGSNFEQVELDIYGYGSGTYQIDSTGAAGSANVQYFSMADGVNNAVSGSVVCTELDSLSGATGSFEVTMEDGTSVTGGLFKNIQR